MRNFQGNGWFWVPVLIGLCAGFSIWLPMSKGEEIYWFNVWRVAPYNSIGIEITHLGELYGWVVLIFFISLKSLKKAGLILLTSLALLGINTAFKDYFDAPRPYSLTEYYPTRPLTFVPSIHTNRNPTSFPSGHTSSAFCMFFLYSQLLSTTRFKPLGLLFGILACAVAVSRIFLAQHFLEDVLAGAILGLTIGWLFWLIIDREYDQ
jgi:membrane-associated phospholipid phosphatase